MPEEQTIERARRDSQQGTRASTDAGRFAREDRRAVREVQHGAREAAPAIAIELPEPPRVEVGFSLPQELPGATHGHVDADTRPSDAPGDVERRLPVVDIHGVGIHAVTEHEAIAHIVGALAEGRGGWVITPNLDHLYRFHADRAFAALLREADLVVPDGMPLIWASRIQGTPLPARVAGSDLIGSLSVAAAEQRRSVFLLGGNPGTADAAAKVLSTRAPGLRVVGTLCPPLGFDRDEAELARIEAALCAAAPDIVFVGLGSPKQENLIRRLRGVLPATWWLGIGASFSFLAGDVRRAPRWMQLSGLEWAHRLAEEPRRLFERYVVIGLPFGAKLLGHATLRRMRVVEMLTPPGPIMRPAELSADVVADG